MRKTLTALLSLSLFVFFSSFAYADHIKAPSVPAEEAASKVENFEQSEPCGVLTTKILFFNETEDKWVILTWKDLAHPFMISRFPEFNFEIWIDHKSDGHFDEYLNSDDPKSFGNFVKKYPTPCSAVTK